MTDDANEMIVAPAPVESGPLRDLRSGVMTMPAARMVEALAEYRERDRTFRKWLLEQLTEGVHYGYPPGCEPKTNILNGKLHYGVWDWKKKEFKWYPEEQWKPKPCFYKAGAERVVDIMGLLPQYVPSLEAWEMLGKPSDTFVMVCRLTSKMTGQLIGEGMGARKVGQKGGDENNALKMAMKSAKVCAVLEAYGLADLFTQDLEDGPAAAPEYDNPNHDQNAPKAQPRGDRVSDTDYKAVGKEWKAMRQKAGLTFSKDDWIDFVEGATPLPRDRALDYAAWSLEDLESIRAAIALELHPDGGSTAKDGLFANDGSETYQ